MAKKVARYGVLLALAFVFSYVEHLFPLPIAIPGIKLGLANLVILVALSTMRISDALLLTIARIALSTLLFGNAYSFAYSLCGGLLSFAVMAVLCRKTRMPCIAVSVVGGVCHNIGQLACAAAVTKTGTVFWYLPILILAGGACGSLTGTVAKIIVERLKKADHEIDGQ